MSFGAELGQLRRSRNITTVELAQKLHVDRSYISKLENDKETPSEKVITDIAKLFTDNEGEKQQLEYWLRCSARKPPESLLDSIEQNPHIYQQIEEGLRQTAKTGSKNIVVLNHDQGPTRILKLAAKNKKEEELQINLPNLPVIGQEAGYMLILMRSLKHSMIVVSSKTKPLSNLFLRIFRQDAIIFEGVTDTNGNVDIGIMQLKTGDIITLDITIKFLLDEKTFPSAQLG